MNEEPFTLFSLFSHQNQSSIELRRGLNARATLTCSDTAVVPSTHVDCTIPHACATLVSMHQLTLSCAARKLDTIGAT